MKQDTIVGIGCAVAIAAALALGTLEISPEAKAPAQAVQPAPATVGVHADEMLALCRAEYGPQSTVYERKPGRLACDTRRATVAKQ